MQDIQTIIQEAVALPVAERTIVVDTLLQSLNSFDPAIDQAWLNVAEQRYSELTSGTVDGIPADVVFTQIRESLKLC